MALAAMIATPLVGPATAASPEAGLCASPSEQAALAVRALQSRLMVAALVCNARTDYNAFVLKYRSALQSNHAILGKFFGRHYGRRSTARQNRFFTLTANDASQLSIADRTRFCDQAHRVYSALGGFEKRSVVKMARFEISVAAYEENICPNVARY